MRNLVAPRWHGPCAKGCFVRLRAGREEFVLQNRSSKSFETRRRQLLEARARQHRVSLNAPEERLAKALAGGRLGVYFRRQVVLGEYIVDLLAPAMRLVVEIDGRCHELRRRADARRDEKLRLLDYVVLRLEAALVMRSLPLAVERVRRVVEVLRRDA